MLEYMEQHSVSRLIGAPPGYVGHEEGGQLTKAARMRPYSVVLFDEVEKAHIAVFNVLLQVLDDGRLTDGQGQTVDFTKTVIVMTSNLGAKHLVSGLKGECSMQAARNGVMQEVRGHFRPELLNRLDEIVVFDPLSHEQLRKVTSLQMKDVASRLAERDIALAVINAALDFVLAESHDLVSGSLLGGSVESHIMIRYIDIWFSTWWVCRESYCGFVSKKSKMMMKCMSESE